MTNNVQKSPRHLGRSWLITLLLFIVVQVVFILLDGTSFEPNLNDENNIAGRILDSDLFTEWISLYSFPWFNLVTFVFVIAIFLKVVKDMFQMFFKRKN